MRVRIWLGKTNAGEDYPGKACPTPAGAINSHMKGETLVVCRPETHTNP